MIFVQHSETFTMRTLGIVLIVVGILMFIFTGFNYQTEKRVADIGPIKIDKTENHSVGWPMYAGGLAVLAGIVVLLISRKNPRA
jgi:uncharacterized membrane protein HdeD (DUF308 family)